ncbi:MAG TPA: TetR/AcrR family transcriptional regulator [Thermoanaerobaculia bacterium]
MATKRQQRKEHLREQIVDAARELFAAEGYEAVTMRRVAEAVDYAVGTIYLHFPDKESLIQEVCERDFGLLAARTAKIARDPDPVERLRRAGLAYFEFALANPNHYRVMFMADRPAIPPESVSHDRHDPQQDAYAFLRMTVAECIETRRFRPAMADVELAAQLVWAAVHGLASLRITKHYEGWIAWKPAKKSAAAMIEAVLQGLLKE